MGLYHTPGRVGSYGWGLVAAWVASGAWYTPALPALAQAGFASVLQALAIARFQLF